MTATLVSALVISQLYYGNVVLAGLPKSSTAPLHVTEALFNLHWLPVPGCMEFKLCVLVYKSFNGIAPSYINDMLQPVMTLQPVSYTHLTLPTIYSV